MKVFYIILFISCFQVYSQQNYNIGITNYGIDMNSKLQREIEESENISRRGKAIHKKIFKANKKIYNEDKVFLILKFNKYQYLSKPVKIMVPENYQKYFFNSGIYYGDIKNNIYIKVFNKYNKNYIFPINKEHQWKIKNDNKNILGFKCRKAVLETQNNNKVIAWFTPQIPVAFSPVKYYGLPGAILEITTPLMHFYAKNIEFKEDVKVEKPTEGIKLSKEEYKAMMTRFKPPE